MVDRSMFDKNLFKKRSKKIIDRNVGDIILKKKLKLLFLKRIKTIYKTVQV